MHAGMKLGGIICPSPNILVMPSEVEASFWIVINPGDP